MFPRLEPEGQWTGTRWVVSVASAATPSTDWQWLDRGCLCFTELSLALLASVTEPSPAVESYKMLFLRAGKVFLELWPSMQPFHDCSSDEFTADDVARIMDRADDPALSIFAATGKQCLPLLGRDFRQNQHCRPPKGSVTGRIRTPALQWNLRCRGFLGPAYMLHRKALIGT